jgi:hypothetical protein
MLSVITEFSVKGMTRNDRTPFRRPHALTLYGDSPKRLQVYYALPYSLAEPALSNDIAAMLLPARHDFEFAAYFVPFRSFRSGQVSPIPAAANRRIIGQHTTNLF